MMTWHIAARELRSLFLSPLAWAVLGVVQFLLAYSFVSQIGLYTMLQSQLGAMSEAPGISDLIVAPVYGNAGMVFLLVTPLLTMRLISEERRSGTLGLVLSAPVSMSEIILGKYLGILVFLLIMAAMLTAMPLSLLAGAELDLGKLAACVLGLTLLLTSYAAVGLFASTFASHPGIAAVGSFGLLLLLWIIDWVRSATDSTSALLEYLSLVRHYEQILKGLVSTADILYFLLLAGTFLVLSVHRLDRDRLQS